MRIKLDRTACDGFGACARHAPDVFSLDDWGYASLTGDGEIPAEAEEPTRRAILDCPVHAITELSAAGQSLRPSRATTSTGRGY